MNHPLHAAHYADAMLQRSVVIDEHVQLACDTYRLRFRCREMAQRFVPGQFLMLRLSACDDPLIGRPLALYDTVLDAQGDATSIDVVYLVKGKFTRRLRTTRPGQQLDVWGPLGNGFPAIRTSHLIMVAGGIGQTPFLALAREYLGLRGYGAAQRADARCSQATLCYGARTAEYLAGLDDFTALPLDLRLATDDGTRGRHGLVTEELQDLLEASDGTDRLIVCCGPEPMMAAVAQIARQTGVPCLASLETPMACGVGICFTCVTRVREPDGSWDYKRTCVEGPVFDAAQIEW